MKVYTYSKCSTCRKAINFLKASELEFEEIPIREKPPTVMELKRMLAYYDGNVKRLFNTSGQDYREGGFKDKLPTMSQAGVFRVLHGNGNLVKRPFLLGDDFGLVGFKQNEWAQQFE